MAEPIEGSGLTKEQSLEAMNSKIANRPFGNVGMERVGDKKILSQFYKLFYKGMRVKIYMYADETVSNNRHRATVSMAVHAESGTASLAHATHRLHACACTPIIAVNATANASAPLTSWPPPTLVKGKSAR